MLFGKYQENFAGILAAHAFGVTEQQHRVRPGSELHALMFPGGKARTPQVRKERLPLPSPLTDHEDEGWR